MSEQRCENMKKYIEFNIKEKNISKHIKYKIFAITIILIVLAVCIILSFARGMKKKNLYKPKLSESLLTSSFHELYVYYNPKYMSVRRKLQISYTFDREKYQEINSDKATDNYLVSDADSDSDFDYLSDYIAGSIDSESESDSDIDTNVDSDYQETISSYSKIETQIPKIARLGLKNLILSDISFLVRDLDDNKIIEFLFKTSKENNISVHILLENYFGVDFRECRHMNNKNFILGIDGNPLLVDNRCILNLEWTGVEENMFATFHFYSTKNIQTFFLGDYPYKYIGFKDRYQHINQIDHKILENEINKIRFVVNNSIIYHTYQNEKELNTPQTSKHLFNGSMFRITNSIFHKDTIEPDFITSIFSSEVNEDKFFMIDVQAVFLEYQEKVFVLGLFYFSPMPVILSALDENLEQYFLNLDPFTNNKLSKIKINLRVVFDRINYQKKTDPYFDTNSKLIGRCEKLDGVLIIKRGKVINGFEYQRIILLYNNSEKIKTIYWDRDLKLSHYSEIVLLLDSAFIDIFDLKLSSDSFILTKKQTIIIKIID